MAENPDWSYGSGAEREAMLPRRSRRQRGERERLGGVRRWLRCRTGCDDPVKVGFVHCKTGELSKHGPEGHEGVTLGLPYATHAYDPVAGNPGQGELRRWGG